MFDPFEYLSHKKILLIGNADLKTEPNYSEYLGSVFKSAFPISSIFLFDRYSNGSNIKNTLQYI